MQELLARIALFLNGMWNLAVARIGAVQWTFAAGGKATLAAGIILALMLVIVCYSRTTEGLTLRSRVTLAGLRFISLVALLVMVSGAVCAIDLARDEPAQLLVVIDDSPSMNLPVDSGGTTRAAAVQQSIDGGAIKHLQRSYDVRIVRTSGASASISDDTDPQDLAAALIRHSSRAGDRPLSHIVLISDGVQLGRRALADAARELPAPVSTLCTAPADGVRDVVLHGASIPPYVYAQDRALVTAEVQSLGMTGEAMLQLFHFKGSGETPVEIGPGGATSLPLTLKPDGEPSVSRVQFVAKEPGLQRYALRILPVEGELTQLNNQVVFHLDVRPERIRVLFVEGEPSWEYKFAKQALEKDPVVEFCGLVRLPGDEWFYQGPPSRPDGKPVISRARDGFAGSNDELNHFDVLILGDLERKIFEQSGRYDLIESFVKDRGGGLATIGGMKVYGAGDFDGTRLAQMLPFEIEREKKKHLINRFNPRITTQGLTHPVLQLELEPDLNAKAWQDLPWVEGGNAIRQTKAAANLLLVHPELKTSAGHRPVAAAWQYGAGRVFSTVLDGTWHWRTARADNSPDYHARYWGLLVRWLAPDPRGNKPVGALASDDPILEVGTPATFSVPMREPNGSPVLDASAEFVVQTPSGQAILGRSSCDPVVPGRYALTFTPTESGEHAVRVALSRGAEEPQTQEQRFLISPSRSEFVDVRPDPAALAEVAAASGGKSAMLSGAAQLRLPEAPRALKIERVTVSLWQSPGMLAILLLALSIEWLLRKRRGLS